MLRARLPLAVALLAATVVIPATAASAADSSSPDPTGVITQQLSGQSQSGSDSSSSNSSSSQSTGSSQGATTTDTSSGSSSQPPDISSQATNPLAGTPLEGLGNTLTDPATIPTDLQDFGSCLQSAGSDTTAGQKCFETFLGAIGLPNTDCFSKNGFTLAEAQAKIEQALTGGQSQLTPEAFQQNFNNLSSQLQDLVTCLTATPSDTSPEQTSPATSTPEPTATSNEAPAAVAVTGNPDFTG